MARIAALFFVSGAAALVVETTWLEWFRLLLGATAPAASATLVAFFAGNALGAAWAGRRAPTWRRPLAVYGRLEAAAAAGALAVPVLLRAGGAAAGAAYDPLRQSPALLTALRFAIALVATLPAAFALGATFAAVGAAALAGPGALGRRGTALYAWNTSGAALGALLAAFLLPDLLGIRATYAVGVGGQLAVAGLALAWARGAATGVAGARPPATPAARPEETPGRRRHASRAGASPPALLLGFAALSGFAALAAQVLLVQAFAQVLDQSVYAFGAVLVAVLVALALGAAAVSGLQARDRIAPGPLLGAALVAAGLAWLAFPALFWSATGGLAFAAGAASWPAYVAGALGRVAAAAGPPLVLSALLLPATLALAGRGARGGGGEAGAWIGRLAAANTAGAIAGALAAPYLLLPATGLFGAFGLLGLLLLAAAPLAPGRRRGARTALAAAGAAGLLVAAGPFGRPALRLEPGERLVEATATAAGSVAVVRRPDGLLIRTDNHYALGGTAERVHEERQGHLPLLLHRDPRRVAFVGTATAITAGAAVAHPVTSIHLVEIVPAVARAAARHFGPANRHVYADPRAVAVLDDARNFLSHTAERFDVVVADLFVPWRSGTSALYAREHFQAVRARLRADGVFCQWLPLYQLGRGEFEMVARTFLDVFPRAALFRGDFYGGFPIVALVGFAGDPPPAAAVSAAARRLGEAPAGVGDRWVTDPLGPWALYVGALDPAAPALAQAPAIRDDRPRIRYAAARRHAAGGAGGARPDAFVGAAFAEFAEGLQRADAAAGHPLFPHLSPAARRAAEGGALLQRAGALYAAGRREAASRALAAAAERLPPRLLAAAPADPSAADVWPARPAGPRAPADAQRGEAERRAGPR